MTDQPLLNMVCEVDSDSDSSVQSNDDVSDSDQLITEEVLIKTEEGLRNYVLEPRKPGIEPSDEPDYEDDHDTLDMDEEALETDSPVAPESEELKLRIGHTDWCSCGRCVPQRSGAESFCCHEEQASERYRDDKIKCIVEHQGFPSVCLSQYVLDTAYFTYRAYAKKLERKAGNAVRVFGTSESEVNKKYRWVAYCQYVRWIHGYLGEGERTPLPSCVYAEIRKTFVKGLHEEHVHYKSK